MKDEFCTKIFGRIIGGTCVIQQLRYQDAANEVPFLSKPEIEQFQAWKIFWLLVFDPLAEEDLSLKINGHDQTIWKCVLEL